MKLLIAAVGKMKRGAEQELYERYIAQTKWGIATKELKDAPEKLPHTERLKHEGESIGALLTGDSWLIAFDKGGENITSEGLAKLIQKAGNERVKQLVFAIGGQDGLDPALLKKAKKTIAFGGVTWPHQLMRVMLAEQLFRASTIIQGHPYHTGH
ncbi:MAG: 23S rRNA (pseudouridine(1915)-N(3))-methyltransferase RlmH [Alphaproteobacteria bacterium]|nr:23S rRNA (pseudouridine(1915)-N(3))-methyltransferase RlmH [Alphaproteobacteria bacterium]